MTGTRPPTADILYERIETQIAEGRFSDGERLDEVRLARDFGVSRTPLREALRLLSATGLVELVPNRGAFVRQPDFTRLVEMFEVMAEIEAWCARLAATRITPARLLLLRQAASACEAALQVRDYQLYYERNATFHGMIYDASGNAFLAEEARNLQRRLKPFRKAQLSVGDRLSRSMSEHREILLALEAGDAARAETVMRAHIRIQGSLYEEFRLAKGGALEDAGQSAG
ncbi:GntR family transcriptional regulator [Rhizobiaceae bacterium BDR2-2]|uniref:GntR family transcriptional regulator n=1 Tax=Ectorhizobium quercum TaxID=2965071 RepID=A0AAE3MYP8_9HYPH|nr:GntR family transcriptional regulator [Ectorhizobium quercum]MCX8997399.1 GntR family transcriptional regulator [Ectorhizobium quercum]